MDFYSETLDGNPRYIVLIDNFSVRFDDVHKQDLQDIKEDLVVYFIKDNYTIVEIDNQIIV